MAELYEHADAALVGYKMEAFVVGSNLIIRSKKQDETIPLSKIQSISIQDPKGFAPGDIIIHTAQANTAAVGIALGVSLSGGAQRDILFTKEHKEEAHAFYEHIVEKQSAPVDAPLTKGVVSVVEEIRGLKQLLDEGILTQEEFSAKKKLLLGI